MTASNFVEIPQELFFRLVTSLGTELTFSEKRELLEDAQQWLPRHTFDYSDYTCVVCGRDRDDPIHEHVH